MKFTSTAEERRGARDFRLKKERDGFNVLPDVRARYIVATVHQALINGAEITKTGDDLIVHSDTLEYEFNVNIFPLAVRVLLDNVIAVHRLEQMIKKNNL